jgi:hypothetical protein
MNAPQCYVIRTLCVLLNFSVTYVFLLYLPYGPGYQILCVKEFCYGNMLTRVP